MVIADNARQFLVIPCYSLVFLGNSVCCARGRPLGPQISLMPFADSMFAARDRPPGSLIFFSTRFGVPGGGQSYRHCSETRLCVEWVRQLTQIS